MTLMHLKHAALFPLLNILLVKKKKRERERERERDLNKDSQDGEASQPIPGNANIKIIFQEFP